MCNTLKSLGCGRPEEGIIEDWLAGVDARERGPDLIRAGRAASDWMNQPGVRDRNPDGIFLGACLWQQQNRGAPIPIQPAIPAADITPLERLLLSHIFNAEPADDRLYFYADEGPADRRARRLFEKGPR